MKPKITPRLNQANLTYMKWQGAAECPGACGELVQGTWNGINFLVPCPINLYSVATIKLRSGCEVQGPSDKPKATFAVRKTLAYLGRSDLGGELTITTKIPAGKGMASSTADIGSAIAATAAALGVSLKPREIAQLAISIEPTDGTLLPGITLLDHVRGSWSLPLGVSPPLQILVVDTGGEVDTLQFNSSPQLSELNRLNEAKAKLAFQLVRRGIQENRPDLLGQGATMSAENNQNILWKPLLHRLGNWGRRRGALGIIAAHSGTVMGLIYPAQADLLLEEYALAREFAEIVQVWQARLIPGGVRLLNPVPDPLGPMNNLDAALSAGER